MHHALTFAYFAVVIIGMPLFVSAVDSQVGVETWLHDAAVVLFVVAVCDAFWGMARAMRKARGM